MLCYVARVLVNYGHAGMVIVSFYCLFLAQSALVNHNPWLALDFDL